MGILETHLHIFSHIPLSSSTLLIPPPPHPPHPFTPSPFRSLHPLTLSLPPGASTDFQILETPYGSIVTGDPAKVVSALSVRPSVVVTNTINTTYGMLTVTKGTVDVTGAMSGLAWQTMPRVDTERPAGASLQTYYGEDPLMTLFDLQR